MEPLYPGFQTPNIITIMADQYYIITNIEERDSKYGGVFYRVHLRDIQTDEYLFCDVVPGNRNFPRWRNIVSNPQHGYILKNLTRSDRKKGLITADSEVEYYTLHNEEEAKKVAAELAA